MQNEILRNQTFYLGIFFCLISFTHTTAQYKTLDFELSSSGYIDDYAREEARYNSQQHTGLVQVGMGVSMSLNEKLVISPKIAFAYALQGYSNNQFSPTPMTIPVMQDYIRKDKTLTFFKVGAALSYWFSRQGKGFFIESELQNITALSANSEELKRQDSGELQTIEEDIKDEMRANVPSLRIGIGFNVPIKRVAFFIRLSRELRLSTYFSTTTNYTFINPSLGMGFRYLL